MNISGSPMQKCRAVVHQCLNLLSSKRESATDVGEILFSQLNEWSECVNNEDMIELMTAYKASMLFYPDSSSLLNGLGNLMFRCGFEKEAAANYRLSCVGSPLDLASRENLDNLNSHLVDRWHYRMLNDSQRNTAYKVALTKALSDIAQANNSNDTIKVLDIGTGTGLLSMYAAQANERVRVDACEMSSVMCDVACSVVSSNKLADRVSVINSKSTDLPCIDESSDRYGLCVMEIFDAGLFGEGVLESLSHAWKNLLHPQCVIVPCKAQMYISAIESLDIRRQNRYLKPKDRKTPVINANFVCLTGQRNITNSSSSSSISQSYTNNEILNECNDPEPYTSEWLNSLPNGYTRLSEPVKLLDVNFNSYEEITSLYTKGLQKTIDIDITNDGQPDAFVVWFDLNLYDDIYLSTSPFNADKSDVNTAFSTCWEQAIYLVNYWINKEISDNKNESENLNLTHSERVTAGDKCTLNITIDDCLRIFCVNLSSNSYQSSSDSKSVSDCTTNLLERNVIAELNNSTYTEAVVAALSKVCLKWSRESSECVNTESKTKKVNTIYSWADCKLKECKTENMLQDNVKFEVDGEIKGATETGCNTDPVNGSSDAGKFFSSHSELDNSEISTANSDSRINESVSKQVVGEKHGHQTEINRPNKKLKSSHWQTTNYKLHNTSDLKRNRLEKCDRSSIKILDLSPNFSLIPLHCLAEIPYIDRYNVTKDGNYKKVYKKLLAENGVNLNKFQYSTAGEDNSELVQDSGWNVVYFDVVDTTGCLRQHILEDIALARLTYLSEKGHIVPGKVKVKGQLVHSSTLLQYSKVVSDESVEPFSVAEHINIYQVRTQRDIDLNSLSFQSLTEKFTLFTLDFNDQSSEPATVDQSDSSSFISSSADDREGGLHLGKESTKNSLLAEKLKQEDDAGYSIQGSSSSEASSTSTTTSSLSKTLSASTSSSSVHVSSSLINEPSFLNVDTTLSVQAIDNNTVTGLVYWFELELFDDIVISTKDSNDGHWKQAVIMLTDEQITVQKNDTITIRALCNNSHIGVIIGKS